MVIIQMVITELVFLQGQTPKVNTFLQLGSVEWKVIKQIVKREHLHIFRKLTLPVQRLKPL